MLHLKTLGEVGLRDSDGRVLHSVLAQPKRFALLVYLGAARPEACHRRESLLPLFWEESDEAAARHALCQALYALGRSLGEEVVATRGSQEVGLGPGVLACDALAFSEAVDAGRWQDALELYQGDFLAGFHVPDADGFQRWVEQERMHYRGRCARAGWALAQERAAAGLWLEADEAAFRAVTLEPANEQEVRAFILTRGRGDRAAAVRFFERWAESLRVDLDLRPSDETLRVVQALKGSTAHDGVGAVPASAGPRSDGRPLVAVLPFASLSDDPDMDHFALGVMEDIVSRLARVRGIRVLSRMSVMRYLREGKDARGIAEELGATAFLEGSARRTDGRVRVVAGLIDGETEGHLWAQTYDRDVEDMFGVQAEIAESIVRALRAELSEEDSAGLRCIPTGDMEAWDAYVRAVQAYQDMGPEDLAEGVRHLRVAIRRDPRFAQAWALLAELLVLAGLCADEPPVRLFRKIRLASRRALELDPRCGAAQTTMGVLRLFHEWDVPGAADAFANALVLAPDDTLTLGWNAIFLVLSGRPEEALAMARRTVALDPRSPVAYVVLGQVLVMAAQNEEAVRVLDAAIRLWPRALHLRMWIGVALSSLGKPEEALPHYRCASELCGRLPHFEAMRATALVPLGRVEEARSILEYLKTRPGRDYVDPYSIFSITLMLDGLDRALPHLEEMVEVRSLFLPYLRGIPRFRALWVDPRFRGAMERVWPSD